MSINEDTTERLQLKANPNTERARWQVRQMAYRLAADCERLLDELLDSNHPGLRDTLSRAQSVTRSLAALLTREAPVQLFDDGLRPGVRLREMQQRLRDALVFEPRALPMTPAEEMAIATLGDMRATVEALFAPATASGVRPEQEPPESRARVLIVDDEPLMVSLLQRTVRAMGHETLTASNGQDGLALIQREPIDLVLTDIEMPVMTGIELLRRIKSHEDTRRTPVLVISSADDMTSVTQCIALGAEDHISKPFEQELLRARVAAALERKRLMDQDTAHRAAVAKLVAAAEAVERDGYSSELVGGVITRSDGLGGLARVFDRMVTGLKTREERLRDRLKQLKREVSISRTDEHSIAPSAESPFAIGDVLSDRYVIRNQIGQGGMGTVYRAYDSELGEDVAVKSVRLDLLKIDPALVERLKSEILLTRRISHPNVVRSHDIGQQDGNYFITMELVAGISVSDLLDQRGRLSISSTLAIATQLCDALAVAHEAGIIHRDIKPANLVVDQAATLKVMDFGIARSIVNEDEPRHTGHGNIIGTPRYMAPELLTGEKASVRSDIYAVGVVLYECLTGHLPFGADAPADLVGDIYKGNFQSLERVLPNVPPSLTRVVHQQLSYDPKQRAGSARELAHKLSEIEVATEPRRAATRL